MILSCVRRALHESIIKENNRKNVIHCNRSKIKLEGRADVGHDLLAAGSCGFYTK